jgi:hypothetical protein
MVGRTVVNFQRLEHNLKLAARLGPLRGTIQKIQKDISKRHERASTLTLGQAIQAWLEYCYSQPSTNQETPDLFDVSVQTSFSLESYPASQAQHADALSALLRARNELIHSRLATFRWESPEACDALVADLKQVNTSIAEQIEYTSALLKAIADLHKEHADALAMQLSSPTASVAGAIPNTSLERTREE